MEVELNLSSIKKSIAGVKQRTVLLGFNGSWCELDISRSNLFREIYDDAMFEAPEDGGPQAERSRNYRADTLFQYQRLSITYHKEL
jgi:hypothetical protein